MAEKIVMLICPHSETVCTGESCFDALKKENIKENLNFR